MEEAKSRESMKDFLSRKRAQMKDVDEIISEVHDDYENAHSVLESSRKHTAIAYDLDVNKHKCDWDQSYPECPERLTAIFNRCTELGLIERCVKIENTENAQNRAIKMHSNDHFNNLKRICQNGELRLMEEKATTFDAVYFNQHTFDAACRSLNIVVSLVKSVAKGEQFQNGFALVRPPGHHAMENEYCGYCYFNNVAIAAQECIDESLAKKIMIIDYDVHHGQATQQMFYNRNDVLYFSIHRYQNGTFWPNLFESNFNSIGIDEGKGYNINVPLNKTELTDSDYLGIVFNILLPVAYEYSPDLIIISAGYDAAIGCPEGKMNVTPGFYSHLITLLNCVSNGKIAVCLEGGYFLPSLSESAAMTLKALLGDPCPILEDIKHISPSVIETITNVRRALINHWKCFGICEISETIQKPDNLYILKYFGTKPQAPYETRNCYPTLSEKEKIYYTKMIDLLKKNYNTNFKGVVVWYDDSMLLHKPAGKETFPERPERLSSIHKLFKHSGLFNRLSLAVKVDRDFLPYNVHNNNYTKIVINHKVNQTRDVYTNENTFKAISNAISGLMNSIDSLVEDIHSSAIGIIRPPGHHADYNEASGFCIFNNIAFVANYLVEYHKYNKILILDFDVHHGNGTQDLFYDTDKVMYISIHRFDHGDFFPRKNSADYKYDGYGSGKGFNINIPFSNDKMGDSEYFAAFFNIILPIAYSYSPQIILISAGFDAGINDPLGHYKVSPETFGHFIQFLKPITGGKIQLVLEGGYNETTIAYGMAMCAKVLLGDSVPMPKNVYNKLSKSACKTILDVTNHFKQYWPLLNANRKLPSGHAFQTSCDPNDKEYVYRENNYEELDFENPQINLLLKRRFD